MKCIIHGLHKFCLYIQLYCFYSLFIHSFWLSIYWRYFHVTKCSSETSWFNHNLFDQWSTLGMLDVSNNYANSKDKFIELQLLCYKLLIRITLKFILILVWQVRSSQATPPPWQQIKGWTNWKMNSSPKICKGGGSLGKLSLANWKDPQGRADTCDLPEQNRHATLCWGEDTWTAIHQLLETPHGQNWELKFPGDPVRGAPMLFWDLYPGAQPGSHGKYWREIPKCFWLGEGKGPSRNTLEVYSC